ncbi:MAG: copper-binding protein [Rhodocyclaceae bacterium]|nr:copper-binding protein [Rhodocyclaceae bacterium]
MKITRPTFAIATLLAVLAMPMAGLAQPAAERGGTDISPSAAMVDGEVRRIDGVAGKITIRHGDIRHLDMPAMTMVFTVSDKALLARVKAGDKIRFMVVREGGRMVVTEIQPVP